MTAADNPRADLVALFDAFAAAAPAYTSIQMHGDAAADALLEWSIEHGHGARTERRGQEEGRTWQAVCVDFPNRSWMTAHRATETTAQADQQVLARVKAALDGEQQPEVSDEVFAAETSPPEKPTMDEIGRNYDLRGAP